MAIASVDSFIKIFKFYQDNPLLQVRSNFKTNTLKYEDTVDVYLKSLTFDRDTSLAYDTDENTVQIALNAREKLSTYFDKVLYPGSYSFNTVDNSSFRKMILDWTSTIKTIQDSAKKTTDAYSLSSDDVDKAMRGFGVDFVNQQSLKSIDRRKNFLLNICDLYSIKGSPASIVKALGVIGLSNIFIREGWIEPTDDNTNLQINWKAQEADQEFNSVSNQWEESDKIDDSIKSWDWFLEKIQENGHSDPYWFYSKDDILKLQNSEDLYLKLPSITPYFGIEFMTDADQQIDTYETLENELNNQLQRYLQGSLVDSDKSIWYSDYTSKLSILECYTALVYSLIRLDDHLLYANFKSYLESCGFIVPEITAPCEYFKLIYWFYLNYKDKDTFKQVLSNFIPIKSSDYCSYEQLLKWWLTTSYNSTDLNVITFNALKDIKKVCTKDSALQLISKMKDTGDSITFIINDGAEQVLSKSEAATLINSLTDNDIIVHKKTVELNEVCDKNRALIFINQSDDDRLINLTIDTDIYTNLTKSEALEKVNAVSVSSVSESHLIDVEYIQPYRIKDTIDGSEVTIYNHAIHLGWKQPFKYGRYSVEAYSAKYGWKEILTNQYSYDTEMSIIVDTELADDRDAKIENFRIAFYHNANNIPSIFFEPPFNLNGNPTNILLNRVVRYNGPLTSLNYYNDDVIKGVFENQSIQNASNNFDVISNYHQSKCMDFESRMTSIQNDLFGYYGSVFNYPSRTRRYEDRWMNMNSMFYDYISWNSKNYYDTITHDGMLSNNENLNCTTCGNYRYRKFPLNSKWNWAVDDTYYYMCYEANRWCRVKYHSIVYISPDELLNTTNSDASYGSRYLITDATTQNSILYIYVALNTWIVIKDFVKDWIALDTDLESNGTVKDGSEFSRDMAIGQIKDSTVLEMIHNDYALDKNDIIRITSVDTLLNSVIIVYKDPYGESVATQYTYNTLLTYLYNCRLTLDFKTGYIYPKFSNYKDEKDRLYLKCRVDTTSTETKWIRFNVETSWDTCGDAKSIYGIPDQVTFTEGTVDTTYTCEQALTKLEEEKYVTLVFFTNRSIYGEHAIQKKSEDLDTSLQVMQQHLNAYPSDYIVIEKDGIQATFSTYNEFRNYVIDQRDHIYTITAEGYTSTYTRVQGINYIKSIQLHFERHTGFLYPKYSFVDRYDSLRFLDGPVFETRKQLIEAYEKQTLDESINLALVLPYSNYISKLSAAFSNYSALVTSSASASEIAEAKAIYDNLKKYQETDSTYMNSYPVVYIKKATVNTDCTPTITWELTIENRFDDVNLGLNSDFLEYLESKFAQDEQNLVDVPNELTEVISEYLMTKMGISNTVLDLTIANWTTNGLVKKVIDFYKPKRARLLFMSNVIEGDYGINNNLDELKISDYDFNYYDLTNYKWGNPNFKLKDCSRMNRQRIRQQINDYMPLNDTVFKMPNSFNQVMSSRELYDGQTEIPSMEIYDQVLQLKNQVLTTSDSSESKVAASFYVTGFDYDKVMNGFYFKMPGKDLYSNNVYYFEQVIFSTYIDQKLGATTRWALFNAKTTTADKSSAYYVAESESKYPWIDSDGNKMRYARASDLTKFVDTLDYKEINFSTDDVIKVGVRTIEPVIYFTGFDDSRCNGFYYQDDSMYPDRNSMPVYYNQRGKIITYIQIPDYTVQQSDTIVIQDSVMRTNFYQLVVKDAMLYLKPVTTSSTTYLNDMKFQDKNDPGRFYQIKVESGELKVTDNGGSATKTIKEIETPNLTGTDRYVIYILDNLVFLSKTGGKSSGDMVIDTTEVTTLDTNTKLWIICDNKQINDFKDANYYAIASSATDLSIWKDEDRTKAFCKNVFNANNDLTQTISRFNTIKNLEALGTTSSYVMGFSIPYLSSNLDLINPLDRYVTGNFDNAAPYKKNAFNQITLKRQPISYICGSDSRLVNYFITNVNGYTSDIDTDCNSYTINEVGTLKSALNLKNTEKLKIYSSFLSDCDEWTISFRCMFANQSQLSTIFSGETSGIPLNEWIMITWNSDHNLYLNGRLRSDVLLNFTDYCLKFENVDVKFSDYGVWDSILNDWYIKVITNFRMLRNRPEPSKSKTGIGKNNYRPLFVLDQPRTVYDRWSTGLPENIKGGRFSGYNADSTGMFYQEVNALWNKDEWKTQGMLRSNLYNNSDASIHQSKMVVHGNPDLQEHRIPVNDGTQEISDSNFRIGNKIANWWKRNPDSYMTGPIHHRPVYIAVKQELNDNYPAVSHGTDAYGTSFDTNMRFDGHENKDNSNYHKLINTEYPNKDHYDDTDFDENTRYDSGTQTFVSESWPNSKPSSWKWCKIVDRTFNWGGDGTTLSIPNNEIAQTVEFIQFPVVWAQSLNYCKSVYPRYAFVTEDTGFVINPYHCTASEAKWQELSNPGSAFIDEYVKKSIFVPDLAQYELSEEDFSNGIFHKKVHLYNIPNDSEYHVLTGTWRAQDTVQSYRDGDFTKCYVLTKTLEPEDIAQQWDSTIEYQIGNLVKYNSCVYVATKVGTNKRPTTATTYWTLVNGEDKQSWDTPIENVDPFIKLNFEAVLTYQKECGLYWWEIRKQESNGSWTRLLRTYVKPIFNQNREMVNYDYTNYNQLDLSDQELCTFTKNSKGVIIDQTLFKDYHWADVTQVKTGFKFSSNSWIQFNITTEEENDSGSIKNYFDGTYYHMIDDNDVWTKVPAELVYTEHVLDAKDETMPPPDREDVDPLSPITSNEITLENEITSTEINYDQTADKEYRRLIKDVVFKFGKSTPSGFLYRDGYLYVNLKRYNDPTEGSSAYIIDNNIEPNKMPMNRWIRIAATLVTDSSDKLPYEQWKINKVNNDTKVIMNVVDSTNVDDFEMSFIDPNTIDLIETHLKLTKFNGKPRFNWVDHMGEDMKYLKSVNNDISTTRVSIKDSLLTRTYQFDQNTNGSYYRVTNSTTGKITFMDHTPTGWAATDNPIVYYTKKLLINLKKYGKIRSEQT